MKKVSKIIVMGFMGTVAMFLSAPPAMAHGQPEVSWSVSIGSPGPAPIYSYSPPPAVYVEPQPVYVRPRPIYVESAPLVHYRTYYPAGYYVDKGRSWERSHWKRHHQRHHRN
ncbi:MAG TPA: hypothetical protein VHK70_09400 [Burkholderiaceae bacterium]|nr:hypothetical protein [Burkholderiaceae bacterium]